MSAWIHILKLWKWLWRIENQYNWKHWVSEEITSDILFCQTAYLWIRYLWMLNRRWNLRKGKLVSLKDYKHFCECVFKLWSATQNINICECHRFFLFCFNSLYLCVHIVFIIVFSVDIKDWCYSSCLFAWPSPTSFTHFGRLEIWLLYSCSEIS